MRMFGAMVVALAVGGGIAPAAAQGPAERGWQVAATFGPYRIDDLAGTPLVPRVELTRFTRSMAYSLAVIGVKGAGYYHLDAMTLDLGVGIRRSGSRAEGALQAGPSTILGGDSDGTPYVAAGANLTAAGTVWLSPRIGLTAGTTARVWFTSVNSTFAPSAFVGLRFRL